MQPFCECLNDQSRFAEMTSCRVKNCGQAGGISSPFNYERPLHIRPMVIIVEQNQRVFGFYMNFIGFFCNILREFFYLLFCLDEFFF